MAVKLAISADSVLSTQYSVIGVGVGWAEWSESHHFPAIGDD